jgi:hypothetical protein
VSPRKESPFEMIVGWIVTGVTIGFLIYILLEFQQAFHIGG